MKTKKTLNLSPEDKKIEDVLRKMFPKMTGFMVMTFEKANKEGLVKSHLGFSGSKEQLRMAHDSLCEELSKVTSKDNIIGKIKDMLSSIPGVDRVEMKQVSEDEVLDMIKSKGKKAVKKTAKKVAKKKK